MYWVGSGLNTVKVRFFSTNPSIALDDEDPAQRNTEKTPTARKATPRFV